MSTVHIHDKVFRPFIDSEAIQRRVEELALLIDSDYRDLKPLFIAVLNGSFIFAADLFRHLKKRQKYRLSNSRPIRILHLQGTW